MSEELLLALVCAPRRRDHLFELADAVSDAAGPQRGQHLSRAALLDRTLPPPAERDRVRAWLEAQALGPILPGDGRVFLVRTTAARVAEVLGDDPARAMDRLPSPIAGLVAGFLTLRAPELLQPVGSTPDNPPAVLPGPTPGYAPAELRRVYNFPEDLDGTGETIGVMSLGGRLHRADLQAFCHACGVPTPEVHEVQLGHPGQGSRLHDLELAISTQWIAAMAPGARIVVYHVHPGTLGDAWSAWMLALLEDAEHAPTIASTTWIAAERAHSRQHGRRLFRVLLAQAAAVGVSVVSASGDWGPLGGVPRDVRDGRAVLDAPWPQGVFPATEDRLLSVGGTMITTLRPLTEQVWSAPPPPGLEGVLHYARVASSGGFSDHVPVPAWQRPHLRPWYARGDGPAVVPYGRGYPDVAMIASGPGVQRTPGGPLTGTGCRMVYRGRWLDHAGGTSLGAPIWAAILALANQARRAAGRPRLGAPAPALYALADAQPSAFRRVLEGSNRVAARALDGSGRASFRWFQGYDPAHGWDPVTGLGVPDVAAVVAGLSR
ncbi:MAG: hypothetical protein H6739_04485 [Alphaproteobacteria bacterium]|nr:hypothetical protein [Alphaproteobacteria bacterium]